MTTPIIKTLTCDQCGQEAETSWWRTPGESLQPLDLAPHFYERVRLNHHRTETEIACCRCERAIAWPR